MVPKREKTCVLPYSGKTLLDLKTRSRWNIEEIYYNVNFTITSFRCKNRINTLLQFKDSIEENFGVIFCYKYCTINYHRKTDNFYNRPAEHMEISNLAGK